MANIIHYLLYAVILTATLIRDGSCHAEPYPSQFGHSNHPHYLPGAINVFEGSCSEETNRDGVTGSSSPSGASQSANTTNGDEDMITTGRGSRSDGACAHVTREVKLGPGITGAAVYMNVSTCEDTSTGYDTENDQGFCYPRKTIVHRINLVNESRNVKSAKFCRDMRQTESKDTCRRLNTTEVYYEDLLKKIPVSVNVGHCGGTCSDGGKCTPTSFNSVTIQTPNGKEQVPVVAECGCARSCYRTTHYELYRTSTDDGKCIEKYVDVGLCTGNCAPSCRYGAPWGPTAGSFGSHSCMTPKCIAASFSYYHIEGTRLDIPVINECRCIVSGYIVD